MLITAEIEVLKVELPDEASGAGVVGERKADLDEMERVDVGFEEGVAIGGGEDEGVEMGTVDHSGELGVHGGERELVHRRPD